MRWTKYFLSQILVGKNLFLYKDNEVKQSFNGKFFIVTLKLRKIETFKFFNKRRT